MRSSPARPKHFTAFLAGLDVDAAHPGQNLIPRMANMITTAPALPGDDGSRAFAEDWLNGPQGFPRAQSPDAATAGDGVEPWDLPQTVIDDPDLVKSELLLALGRRAEGLQLLEQVYWRFHKESGGALSPHAAFPISWAPTGSPLRLPIISSYSAKLSVLPKRRSLSSVSPIPDTTPAWSRSRPESLRSPRSFCTASPFRRATSSLPRVPMTAPAVSCRSFRAQAGRSPNVSTYPNYSTELLDLPIVSIRFGAYYLRWARDLVGGNDIAALAGYNAGPRKASYWLSLTEPDDALFIYKVPYYDTRRYLQDILICFVHYLRIYGRFLRKTP